MKHNTKHTHNIIARLQYFVNIINLTVKRIQRYILLNKTIIQRIILLV